LIRFGPVRSANFGHFVAEPEVYLSKRDVGLDDSRAIDIQYYSHKYLGLPVCNEQLKKMWDRTLLINRLARWPDWVNRSLPGGAKHMVPPGNDRDIYGCFARTRPHLSFSADEEELGRRGLRELGIPDGSPFVGFHARDPAWLEYLAPSLDFHYHDHRDSDIHNYIPAMQALVDRGYFAIRMGFPVKCALDTSHKSIIDYSTNGSRTDFMDIYLGAKCRFFIGSATGITKLPSVFRRPTVVVNWIPLEYIDSWNPNDVIIPKKLWLRAEGRFLTFREILESGLGWNLKGELYEEMGIDAIENTHEEITAAVLEAEERMQGTWQAESEDEELQQRFWSLLDNTQVHVNAGEPLQGVIASRIGADFLRCNRELLD
jgi:putative glycosyltransferase (TIGR04372 family)